MSRTTKEIGEESTIDSLYITMSEYRNEAGAY
jgi:hypothetical protein